MYACPSAAIVGISIVRGWIDGYRTPLERWDSTVRDTRVMQILVTGRDVYPVAWHKSQRRIDAGALQVDVFAEAIGVLIHPIEANREFLIQRMIEVSRHTLITKTSELSR